MSSDWPLSRFRFSLDDNHKLRNCVLSAPSPPTELKARIPTAPITSAAYCKICNTKLVFRSPDTFPDICQLAFAGWLVQDATDTKSHAVALAKAQSTRKTARVGAGEESLFAFALCNCLLQSSFICDCNRFINFMLKAQFVRYTRLSITHYELRPLILVLGILSVHSGSLGALWYRGSLTWIPGYPYVYRKNLFDPLSLANL